MTLYVHRAERADRLVLALAELLAEPLADPFAVEVVSVPARGVERWLTQQLSRRLGRREGHQDGICAGVRFPAPTALIAELLGTTDIDPWAPDSLVWPLLDVIDASIGEPWCETLSTHLGVGADEAELMYRRGRRYSVARRLAGLFDGYATQRPAMLAEWAAGADTDGLGATLRPDLGWQPELWRRLRSRIGQPDPVQRSRAIAEVGSSLPERVSLFGPTRLPAAQLAMLSALAEHRDVHLWLPHPSPTLWEAVKATQIEHPVRREVDPTVLTPAHPLLSSLGRDARELQIALLVHPHVDRHHRASTLPDTLLGRLQSDLRDDRRPAGRGTLADGDRSVQVHACHGPSRQVDVLREVLVGLLAADPSLEPRDILVMCPDIESYAPLIAAAFGLADVVEQGHPAHRLRVRLADRALIQTNLLLATVSRLLELADARVTASQLLDIAAWPPVRRRFGFTDDDLEKLARWALDAGVRWGLDAAHRQPFGLSQFPHGTWRAGLDRILLGATMSEDSGHWVGLALPLDDVGSGDVDLAGRLAELADRLQICIEMLAGAHTIQQWLDALAAGTASLTRVTTAEAWQSAELDREFAAIAAAAGDRAGYTLLRLPDVRALLAGRLGGRPTRANFRTGNLTVCTMVPMRSVPHRVVCLLGLDDGIFPRGAHPDGDDVLARDPVVGERDRRGEDRQLMLDALLAATETLVITYTGADERTGAIRPPSVPVGELLDTLDDMGSTADATAARNRVLTRHPLQPFDSRNVIADALGTGGSFSFDPAALKSAIAAAGPRSAPPAFLPHPLPDPAPSDIDLADLASLLQNPARGFLRQRLDVAVRYDEDEPSDALPVELDALQRWALGDRLLRDRLSGIDQDSCRQAEWRRGTLPPGPLGQRILDSVMADLEPLVNTTTGIRIGERVSLDVAAPVGSRTVTGTVGGIYGSAVVSINYGRLSAGHRLRAWLGLVLLSAGIPNSTWTAVTVGRGSDGAPEQSTLGPIAPEQAQVVLAQLVDLYDRGLREPLPLPVKTSSAYAQARHRRRSIEDALWAARQKWASDKFPGEDTDQGFVRVWGPGTSLEQLLLKQPQPDEHWLREPSRFGELALRLWTPLLDAERREAL